MGNVFSKFVIKEDKADVLHTSAYAKAQNGSSFGAASTESFETRKANNQNRTFVRSYNDSQIMSSSLNNNPRPKTYTPPTSPLKTEGTGMNRAQYSAQNRSTLSKIPAAAKPATPPARKNPGIFR